MRGAEAKILLLTMFISGYTAHSNPPHSPYPFGLKKLGRQSFLGGSERSFPLYCTPPRLFYGARKKRKEFGSSMECRGKEEKGL